MYEPNVSKILGQLADTDIVLDVGGWACPFNRANWIMDAQPYETRGFYRTFGGKPFQAGEKEWFKKETWVQRDICEKSPYPFADKFFDFAICSHTLEDIRDPLWVCSELSRIAKRGYIEIPSRLWESTRGIEHKKMVGLSHHRWLIEIDGNKIRFLMKNHAIHTHWRFSFPRSFLKGLPQERTVTWLYWNDSFEVEETTIHGQAEVHAELERFISSIRPYSALSLKIDRGLRAAGSWPIELLGKLKGLFGYSSF